jgi:hypothetical protein
MKKLRAVRFVSFSLALFAALTTIAAGKGQTQADFERLAAEIEKAWQAKDFPRVEADSRKLLAAMPRLDSPEAVGILFYLSASETVAGRVKDAGAHLDQALENLALYSCRTQLFPYDLAGRIVSQSLYELPPGSRPHLQVVWNQAWENLARKGRETGPPINIYRGLATILASGLASLYQLSGAPSVAASYAGEALRTAPPVEIYDIPTESETICGCYKIETFKQFLEHAPDSEGYHEYVRTMFHLCSLPPRAWALLSAVSVYMQTNDLKRLRETAMELEDLHDRSLTTRSLESHNALSRQIDEVLALLKKKYPQFWQVPSGSGPSSLAEVESHPSLGRTGPPFVKKFKDGSWTYWRILLEATLPPSMDRTVTDQPWWLYRWEEGRLRVVGRARTFKGSKRPKDTWELHVERLALGSYWYVGSCSSEYIAGDARDLLGPVFCSRELLGSDVEALPAHRVQLFREGLPWTGMSERLMRINMRSCTKVMVKQNLWPRDFFEEQTIDCALGRVKLRGGRIVGISR